MTGSTACGQRSARIENVHLEAGCARIKNSSCFPCRYSTRTSFLVEKLALLAFQQGNYDGKNVTFPFYTVAFSASRKTRQENMLCRTGFIATTRVSFTLKTFLLSSTSRADGGETVVHIRFDSHTPLCFTFSYRVPGSGFRLYRKTECPALYEELEFSAWFARP